MLNFDVSPKRVEKDSASQKHLQSCIHICTGHLPVLSSWSSAVSLPPATSLLLQPPHSSRAGLPWCMFPTPCRKSIQKHLTVPNSSTACHQLQCVCPQPSQGPEARESGYFYMLLCGVFPDTILYDAWLSISRESDLHTHICRHVCPKCPSLVSSHTEPPQGLRAKGVDILVCYCVGFSSKKQNVYYSVWYVYIEGKSYTRINICRHV